MKNFIAWFIQLLGILFLLYAIYIMVTVNQHNHTDPEFASWVLGGIFLTFLSNLVEAYFTKPFHDEWYMIQQRKLTIRNSLTGMILSALLWIWIWFL